MRAHFNAQNLPEIFRDLYLGEWSGVLVLSETDNKNDKRIYFDRGMIYFAESEVEEENLGSTLVRGGAISQGALMEAQRSVDGSSDGRALATVLVHRDLLAKETLFPVVRAIEERVVRSAFQWPEGSARYEVGDQPSNVLETDIIVTIELILHGVFHMAGFERIHEAMRALDNRLRIRQPPPIPIERLALSPSLGFILSRVDGNTHLKSVISILPGEEETAARFLFGLLVLGVVEYDPPLGEGAFKIADILRDHADRQAVETIQEQMIHFTYGQVRQQNPYEALGLGASATPPQIKRAYEETKAQFSRERLLPRVRDRFRSELAVIESRLIEAFLTLTQPEGARMPEGMTERLREDIEVDDLRVRMEMDKPKSKVAEEQANKVADAYYGKARRCVREGDFHNAIQYAKLAISYNPSDARYYFLLAECQARNPDARWQRMAEENFAKATQLDPWNAEYWISLGRFYKKRGLNIRARKQFEEALKLVPNNDEILQELASLA